MLSVFVAVALLVQSNDATAGAAAAELKLLAESYVDAAINQRREVIRRMEKEAAALASQRVRDRAEGAERNASLKALRKDLAEVKAGKKCPTPAIDPPFAHGEIGMVEDPTSVRFIQLLDDDLFLASLGDETLLIKGIRIRQASLSDLVQIGGKVFSVGRETEYRTLLGGKNVARVLTLQGEPLKQAVAAAWEARAKADAKGRYVAKKPPTPAPPKK